jgi:hypothetical protein
VCVCVGYVQFHVHDDNKLLDIGGYVSTNQSSVTRKDVFALDCEMVRYSQERTLDSVC